MRLKSFHGANLNEAMRLVRDALGDDAIIISTRDEESGGVRVTAAIDETPVAPHAPQTAFGTTDTPDEDIIDEIADNLYRHGTPAALTEKIVTSAMRVAGSSDAAGTLAAAFDGVLRFSPLEDGARHVLLIGPPGAGKTAMVGKLAARAALAGKKVAIITTDLARAGGIAQLQAYTSTLRIPLLEVEDPHALTDALAVHNAADIVYVDSTGRNPNSPEDAKELQQLIKAAGGKATLVLPAGLDAADGADMASAFKQLGATHLLTTRLDLVRRLGSLLAVAHESRLPFSEASCSPAIASGLEVLDAPTLARRILGIAPQPASANGTADAKTLTANSMNYGKR